MIGRGWLSDMAENINYYNYDRNNIAKTLQKAMSNNADVTVVKYLNDVRKRKIADGGEEMSRYANDNLTRAADEYVESFRNANIEKINEARREAQKMSLQRAYDNIVSNYEAAEKSIEKSGSEARRAISASAHKDNVDTVDMLANLGLGGGAYANNKSGAAESAKVKLASDAAEKIMDTYNEEQSKKANAAQAAQSAMAAAEKEYMQNTDEAYSQLESDVLSGNDSWQERRIKQMELSADNGRDERDFDYTKEKDAYERAYNERKDAYEAAEKRQQQAFDNAMSAFEMTGVVSTEEQAEILGLPVGTKSEFMENLAYQKTLDNAELETVKQQQEFERNYNMFKDVGAVVSQSQAKVLGVPVGTQYWQYVEGMMRANASVVSANASATSASAAQTNAQANYRNSLTNAKNAQTNAFSAQMDALHTMYQNRKINEEVKVSKQKREQKDKMYDY